MKIPIILGVEGESRALVEAAGGGLAIEPENDRQLAESVVRLAENPAFCEELGDNGRNYVANHYDRKMLAQRYEKVISSALEGGK